MTDCEHHVHVGRGLLELLVSLVAFLVDHVHAHRAEVALPLLVQVRCALVQRVQEANKPTRLVAIAEQRQNVRLLLARRSLDSEDDVSARDDILVLLVVEDGSVGLEVVFIVELALLARM